MTNPRPQRLWPVPVEPRPGFAAARERYAQRWRGTRPPGVASVDYLHPPFSLPLRVHLRALLGWDRPLRAAAMAPAKLWRLARWYGGGCSAAVARVPGPALDRYAAVAGTPSSELPERLRAVLTRHTVTARDALGLGLIVDLDSARSGERGRGFGGAGTTDANGRNRSARSTLENAWSLFVYDHEDDWNLVASMAITAHGSPDVTADGLPNRWRAYRHRVMATRSQLAALSDKHETSLRLDGAGIPTVATLLVPAGAVAAAAGTASIVELIERATGKWPTASDFFAKPRSGSRGLDSFVITRTRNPGGVAELGTAEAPEGGRDILSIAAGGDTWQIRRYQAGGFVGDGATASGLPECLCSQDYLVQPLLRTAKAWQDVAADSDVVTVRVVTRDVGHGPRVFSRVVEVPLPPENRGQFYLLVAVDESGVAGAPALPLREADAMGAEARAVWERVTGRLVPRSAELDALAELAHRHFPGVFAVAWDIALTDDGPLFLEGNSGFGTFTPQVVSGGLLSF